ncbi:MAG: exodeoxyribonuclease III [Deltaproteobacteria bacterium]|nr:exodeoxyribonuclease III [Deltaproteobacteria bacterium]
MKLLTWNVNSIRLRLDRLADLCQREAPDVLCLQELKCTDADFPSDAIAALGYNTSFWGQKGYNGVAILARAPLALRDVRRNFAGSPVAEEARSLWATVGDLRIASLYMVNGQSVGSDKYQVKLDFFAALTAHLQREMIAHPELVIAGDFNVAPEDRDVYDPRLWKGRILCSDREREALQALLGLGLVDLHRQVDQSAGVYSWWDYRFGQFSRDRGLRIDLLLGSAALAQRVSAATVDRRARDPKSSSDKPSDHAPVIVTIT